MRMNRQTLWLMTMLSLMVVLSAYYILTGPVEPATQTSQSKPKEDVKVDLQSISKEEKEQSVASKLGKHDFFMHYHLQRDTLRSKLTEEYMRVLSNPDASKKELQEAEAKIHQLMKIDKQESAAEDMIRREGFRDAVVISQNNHVDVIVQADRLSEEQAVSIISMMQQHFHVEPTQVSVQYQA
jgi:stage III sporulation protein AH